MTHAKLKAGEVAGTYHVTSPVTETDIITMAKRFARRKLAKGRKITQPSQAFEHLQLLLQDYEHEVFSVLFLDSQHRVIRFEELFRGTIDGVQHPFREVLKAGPYNADAGILNHNHPISDPEPSDTDQLITEILKEALGLMHTRVPDHVVVGGDGCKSLLLEICLYEMELPGRQL